MKPKEMPHYEAQNEENWDNCPKVGCNCFENVVDQRHTQQIHIINNKEACNHHDEEIGMEQTRGEVNHESEKLEHVGAMRN